MYEELFVRNGLTLERLRAFLEVVEAGGLARAAPSDPTRQSQLSRQIGQLQDFFGEPLVERRGRLLAPTAAGLRLAGVVRDAFAGMLDVVHLAAESPSEFILGGGDSVLQGWVIPRLAAVLDRVPRTTLRLIALSSEDVAGRLADAQIDLGLLRGAAPHGLRSRRLGTIRYALFVPRGLRPPRSSLEQVLVKVPLALQTSEPQVNRCLLALAGKELPLVRLQCETFVQALRAVRSGSYASVLPTIARGDLAGGGFDEIALPASPDLTLKLTLAWRAQTERTRPFAAPLIEELVRHLSLGKQDA